MRVACATMALGLCAAAAGAQSLGDAARGEARKRGSQPPAPTASAFTDEDLRGRHVEVAPAPVATRPAPSPSKAASSSSAGPGHDPVREELDREAGYRHAREETWKRDVLARVARLAEAERAYRDACGPSALDLAGG